MFIFQIPREISHFDLICDRPNKFLKSPHPFFSFLFLTSFFFFYKIDCVHFDIYTVSLSSKLNDICGCQSARCLLIALFLYLISFDRFCWPNTAPQSANINRILLWEIDRFTVLYFYFYCSHTLVLSWLSVLFV